jgi:signal peptidase I
MRTPLPKSHSILRILSERCLLVLMAAILLRTWCVEGLVIVCRVTSGSMAETLLGQHREVVCGDCGYPFACGSDPHAAPPAAVCPNCGCAENDLESQPDISGDGLLIQKSIYRLRRPRRWEVIAFRHPEKAAQVLVKRVVGLPGERVEIRHGDVYVDGKIQRKSYAEQRAVAILVHDTNCPPSRQPLPPARWQGRGAESRWASAGPEFACLADKNNQTVDWLDYRHWRRRPSPAGTEVLEAPITDVCGYNQTQPRREEEVQPVTDVMLTCTLVDSSGEGRLVVRAFDGSEEFQLVIEPDARRWRLLHNEEPVPSAEGPLPGAPTGLPIEVSLCDRQFVFGSRGKPVVVWGYTPATRRQPTSRPLAIGAQGLEVKVRDLQVYRDIYYTHPIGLVGRWGVDRPAQLGDGEYFVLGDNSPISEDSRTWPTGPAISESLLVGKPLLVHFPCRLVYWGETIFQVPDLGKIRYIQ